MRNSIRLLAAAAVCLLAFGGRSDAAPVQAINFTSPTVDFTNGTWSLGFRFIVGPDPIAVTHLGFYDSGQNGLSQSHAVGIYTDTGTLLTSTTVTSGDPLIGFFRYNDIPDLILAANTAYRIAGVTGVENYTWNPTGFVVDPRITFDSDRFTSSATLVFPNAGSSGVNGWFGPNFQLQAVPEPTSLALFGLMGVAAAAYYRRRKPQVV